MPSWKILGFALIFSLAVGIGHARPEESEEEGEENEDRFPEFENSIEPVPVPDYAGFFEGLETSDVNDFREPRIVNGRNARRNEFPHQVAILFRNGPYFTFTCAGSIYNRNFIITAGHCLEGANGRKLAPADLRVIAGELEVPILEPANSQKLIQVSSINIHKSFDGNLTPLLLNDIGMIELAVPLNYSASVRKIRVAFPNEAVSSGVADVAGWGRTEVHLPSGQPLNEQPLPNPLVLRTARLRIVPRQLCTVRYFIIVPETLLCVGSEGLLDTQSACYGDSGGPLICTAPGGQYLCGIVSIGPGCGLRLTPAFYTDVAKFNDWIISVGGSQN